MLLESATYGGRGVCEMRGEEIGEIMTAEMG